MSPAKNPWDIPEWHYIGRECALVKQLVGSGATSLGRANYADKKGEYYTAFFGLSVGLERLAKLILVGDYAITNTGRMPPQKEVKKFGHNLSALMDGASEVSTRRSFKIKYTRPASTISKKVVECLDAFADAGKGRYANFAALGDPNLSQHEPIQKWWGEVAELILQHHYYGKPIQKRVEGQAKAVDALMSPFSMVLHIDETGSPMQDVLTASIRTGQNRLVQRYGRYHALTIVRWLSDVYSELARSACYKHNVDPFFGSWEYFSSYRVPDEFLKTRKVWPLD